MITGTPTAWQRLLASPYICEPVRAMEEAEFYWTTDLKTTEIVEGYGLDIHTSKLSEFVGPARLVGCDCSRCGQPISVFSRTNACARVADLVSGHRSMAAWADPTLCVECKTALREAEEAPLREQWRAREARERELRFMPYRDYLQTPEWQSTRSDALRRARYQCQTCAAGGALHVHHRTYARRGNEYASDLIVLCADCHELFHRNARLAEGGRAA